MRILKNISISLILMSIMTVAFAQTAFKYNVTVRNAYPDISSMLMLDKNAPSYLVPFNSDYYNPYPSDVIGPGQSTFVYCGGICKAMAGTNAGGGPSVVYALLGPDPNNNQKIIKLLACRLDYSNCTAKATPIVPTVGGGPGCNATATSVANGCNITFKFFYNMSKVPN